MQNTCTRPRIPSSAQLPHQNARPRLAVGKVHVAQLEKPHRIARHKTQPP